jgi:hypothetical protein
MSFILSTTPIYSARNIEDQRTNANRVAAASELERKGELEEVLDPEAAASQVDPTLPVSLLFSIFSWED